MQVPDLESLDYVFKAVTQIRTELNGRVPLIGFSGSPWTLACYMVEGGGSKEFHTIKKMLYNRPELMHHILAINATSVAQYLNAQIDAGAQAVMIFDSWGGALADGAYQEFSLSYMRQVVAQLKRDKDGVKIPAIVFTKGGGQWIEQIADIGADAVGLDWTVNLERARQLVGHKVGLQGNLDPAILFASPDQIRAEVAKVLNAFGAPSEGTRSRVQPRSWHFPVHPAGIGGGHGGSRAQPEPRPARRPVTSPAGVCRWHRKGRFSTGSLPFLLAPPAA